MNQDPGPTLEIVCYLRAGRKVRAVGEVVERGKGPSKGLTKVKPAHGNWKCVWLTAAEIAGGAAKPPPVPRRKAADGGKSPRAGRQRVARTRGAAKHHPKLLEAWRRYHAQIPADLVPDPSPAFVVAWNLGYEEARQEAGIFATKNATGQPPAPQQTP